MSLKSLTIVFGFDIINFVLILSKEPYFFLTCKHRPDGKENFDLIIKRNMRIFKLLTGFQ